MKITAISTAVVAANFDYTFVRVHTDEGLHGTGEAFFAPGLTATVREFGSLLIGLEPRNVNACLARLLSLASCFGGTSGAGMAYNAISGIEAALWDLSAKAAGLPLVEMWGGAVVTDVPVYADLHAGTELVSLDSSMHYRVPHWASDDGSTHTGDFYYEAAEAGALEADAWIARARQAVDDGFRILKFDLDVFPEQRGALERGLSRGELQTVAHNAHALRTALGPSIDLAFDCHWRFDVPSSIRICEAIADIHPLWLEDPTPPSPQALAAIANASSIPIATGENTYRVEGFVELIAGGAARVLQPDFQKTGGLLEGLRIADTAARAHLPIAPHCIASPLGLMATATVCATTTNTLAVEFHGSDVPFWSDLVRDGQDLIKDGHVRVGGASGVGVELDQDVVRRYAKPGEPVFDDAY